MTKLPHNISRLFTIHDNDCTAHGAVNNRDKFNGLKFSSAKYEDPDAASFNGAPLSPHHSHFLFIVCRSMARTTARREQRLGSVCDSRVRGSVCRDRTRAARTPRRVAAAWLHLH